MSYEVLSRTEIQNLVKEEVKKTLSAIYEDFDKLRNRILKLEDEMHLVLKYYGAKK